MIVLGLLVLVLGGMALLALFVEHEANYVLQPLHTSSGPRALILYHPSRDAHFADDLSVAIGQGLNAAGYSVDRATLTGMTPAQPLGYRLVVIVSNTYFWTPDIPTLRYLKRARLNHLWVIGVIAGAGSTTRSERLMQKALIQSGASVLAMHAYWIAKPNEESPATVSNREVALQSARQLGMAAARGEISARMPAQMP